MHRDKKLHPLEAGQYLSYANAGLPGAHQNDPLVLQRDPPITHSQGEPVTFFSGKAFLPHESGITQARQA